MAERAEIFAGASHLRALFKFDHRKSHRPSTKNSVGISARVVSLLVSVFFGVTWFCIRVSTRHKTRKTSESLSLHAQTFTRFVSVCVCGGEQRTRRCRDVTQCPRSQSQNRPITAPQSGRYYNYT